MRYVAAFFVGQLAVTLALLVPHVWLAGIVAGAVLISFLHFAGKPYLRMKWVDLKADGTPRVLVVDVAWRDAVLHPVATLRVWLDADYVFERGEVAEFVSEVLRDPGKQVEAHVDGKRY